MHTPAHTQICMQAHKCTHLLIHSHTILFNSPQGKLKRPRADPKDTSSENFISANDAWIYLFIYLVIKRKKEVPINSLSCARPYTKEFTLMLSVGGREKEAGFCSKDKKVWIEKFHGFSIYKKVAHSFNPKSVAFVYSTVATQSVMTYNSKTMVRISMLSAQSH